MVSVDLAHDVNARPPNFSDWGYLCPHDNHTLVPYQDGVRCPECDRFWSYVNPVRFYPDDTEE